MASGAAVAELVTSGVSGRRRAFLADEVVSTRVAGADPPQRDCSTGQHLRGGTTALRCGGPKLSENPTWGYRHLLKHSDQWSDKSALTQQNWRDVADYGIQWALKDPDKVTYRAENETFCFSRIIYLINKKTGRTVGHTYPNVSVSAGNKNVITAYPAGSQCR